MQYARVYKPVVASGTPMPVVVYDHGGGWVIPDVKTYDAAPRLLAKQLNARGAYDANQYAVARLRAAIGR